MEIWCRFWIILSTVCQLAAYPTRQVLVGFLLHEDRYDASIIPEFDEDYPTNVTMQITITDMHSVSETSMDYSVDMILQQRWRDHRLDYTRNSSIAKLELDSKNIENVWQPDTFFRNEKRAVVHTVTTTNKLMHIYTNGTVIYNMRLAMTLSCTMDLHIYPFDGQSCPIYIQSFAYTKENINLNWWERSAVVIDELEMPQFELSTKVCLADYEKTYYTGVFSTLEAEIHMRRKSGFYFLQVFIPSILLVALSWVSFWVDPAAVPARVSLGVTCILTMTTQSSGTRQTLPPVSYIKAIDVWMFVCLLFVFSALLEFAYVNVLLRRPLNDHELTVAANGEMTIEPARQSTKSRGHNLAMKVDWMSRFAFPGAFVVFIVVFSLVCVFTPKSTFQFTKGYGDCSS